MPIDEAMSRMGAVQAIQRTLGTSFVEVIIGGLMAMVTVGVMLLYSWKPALVNLLAVGLYLGLCDLASGHTTPVIAPLACRDRRERSCPMR